MASPTTKRKEKRLIPIFLRAGRMQTNPIATYVGHHFRRSLSLWRITEQLPTILI
jgi:hypothetical protein